MVLPNLPGYAICIVFACAFGGCTTEDTDGCPTQKCVCKPTMSLEWSPSSPGPCSNATFDWLLQTAMAKISAQSEDLEHKTAELKELKDLAYRKHEESQTLQTENRRLTERNRMLKDENTQTLEQLEDLQFNKAKVNVRPKDCADVQKFGYQYSGIYTIYPGRMASEGIDVFCDLNTDHGGWMVLQRRQDGATSFQRNWEEYKLGFGKIGQEFYLGNHYIHEITSQREYELRIDMTNFAGDKVYASYTQFSIDSEEDLYKLNLGTYKGGSAGDSLASHRGSPFSTSDKDNDKSRSGNCSELYGGGGWWFTRCYDSNLNGLYEAGEKTKKGIVWYTWNYDHASLKQVDMKIRPSNFRE